MIPGGYILSPRCFDQSDAAHLPPCTREVWHLVLRNVNHADKGQYKRGQAFFKYPEIQNALHWYVGNSRRVYSKPQISKAFGRLSEERMLETRKATRGVVVTILNYDLYQDPKSYEGNAEESPKRVGSACGGDTKNKKLRSKKEEVESKPLSSSDDEVYISKKGKRLEGKRLETFKTFWNAFDYKEGKAEAADSWLAIPTLTDSLCETIFEAARRECAARPGKRVDGKTPKMAQGWLTARRWEDEPEQPTSDSTGGLQNAKDMEYGD